MKRLLRYSMSGSLALLLGLGTIVSAAQPDPTVLERRLQSVGTLIDSSSASRQIDSSADPLALERRARARALHGQAKAALRAGDAAGASLLLDQATREMLAAARGASPETVTGEKIRNDFERRARSVESLLDAQRRISAEKQSGDPEASRSFERAQQLLAEARQLARSNDLARARRTVDQAYLITKVSLESLRRGDTLVRSLHFATKREEYEYEIDRNDTHRMLADVLLAEKRATNPTLERSVQGHLEQAARLRAEAEARANDGDHPAAIALLEDSTRRIVRAIRGAGVYIPG